MKILGSKGKCDDGPGTCGVILFNPFEKKQDKAENENSNHILVGPDPWREGNFHHVVMELRVQNQS